MVVNIQIKLVITLFSKFVLTERNITDCNIKEVVGERGLFKSAYLNICVLIELFCYSA